MAGTLITQEHPLYTEWKAQWKLLGEAFEGSGGFLDGTNLVAHPRELDYKRDANGRLTTDLLQERVKFTRRKDLSRYENFAAPLVDTLISYQFAKPIVRTIDRKEVPEDHPLALWWDNVDGRGTHIDEWMEHHQTMADVYGHVVVVMDRDNLDEPAATRADQAPPRLVTYIPEDVPDWISERRHLTAIKTADVESRDSLLDSTTEERTEYRIWTEDTWQIFNDNSDTPIDTGVHGFEELPVVIFYGRRRASVPIIGRSVLGDAMLYVDHFNLVSELRELLRSQTFSMLNIVLGEDEDMPEARARMGDTSSTETLLFTRSTASFIAPPNGPADVYDREMTRLERKMFRAAGIPFEADSRATESGDSRRIKANELDRRLTQHADEAQRVDYALARLFYIANYGREDGLRRWANENLVIVHPNEFVTTDLEPVLDAAERTLAVPVGPTAKKLVLQRLVPKVLPDASPEELDQIQREIIAIPMNLVGDVTPTEVRPPEPDDVDVADDT